MCQWVSEVRRLRGNEACSDGHVWHVDLGSGLSVRLSFATTAHKTSRLQSWWRLCQDSKPFVQNPLEHKMLGCLPLEFSYPWSSVSKLRLCARFPRAQSNKTDQTLHQVGIPYLLAEHGNRCLCLGSGLWMGGWRGCPYPKTLSHPGSCRPSFTRSCGRSAPYLSHKVLSSCLLAEAFFRCYRERGLEGGESTISPCGPVLTHPD